ncbi:MAG TPA: M28 family peptidase [Ktedonobacterales bacterium]
MLFAVALAGLLLAGLPSLGSRTSATASAHPLALETQPPTAELPAVDPGYIYDQLAYMATHFQHREAGYDNNLPVSVSGHDEFADYWTHEMLSDLSGFGAVARRDAFPVKGWAGRPAVVPAFNVEVTVPGATHAEQMVVIGCHYDGEASSTQSANDDGSGCAIELGIAKAMAAYWRTHHVFPARTLRFVIFDAEEQGLYGSFYYLNATVNGDVGNIVAMFNEEQNGIGYPLRFLGLTSNPVLPFSTYLSPLTDNSLYPHQDQLSGAQRATLSHFRAEIAQAIPAVFAEFQALGYSTLDYTDASGHSVAQPIFGANDATQDVHILDDDEGSSDQVPFTLAGVPAAMLIGNFSYYNPDAPPWSYPYDQPTDTIQLMNTYASGCANESKALELALALPGMLTAWMLAQPDVLGAAASDGKPIAAISDVGQPVAGQPLALDARASFDPSSSGSGSSALSYAWSFGDGATASGQSVSHTYAHAGSYTLTLKVSGSAGTRTVSKSVTVVAAPTVYDNPYAAYPAQDGRPPTNTRLVLPQSHCTSGGTSTAHNTTSRSGLQVGAVVTYAVIVLVILALVAGLGLLLTRRRSRH